MSNGWNFDMSAAPKGEAYTRVISTKNGHKEAPGWRYQKVILASGCGVVTVGRWLPLEDRWEMFTQAVPPIAWQPWPTSPVEVQS